MRDPSVIGRVAAGALVSVVIAVASCSGDSTSPGSSSGGSAGADASGTGGAAGTAAEAGLDATDATTDATDSSVSDGPAGADAAPDADATVATDAATEADAPLSCPAGTADCDLEPSNGCEADLSSVSSCGSCSVACLNANGGQACVAADAGASCVPTCNTGFGDCNGKSEDGCESSLSTVAHCGSCATQCANPNGTTSCNQGVCAPVCSPNKADCDGNPANGCEADLQQAVSTCQSPTDLGSAAGDTTCGTFQLATFGCKQPNPTTKDFKVVTDFGGRWYKATLAESSDCLAAYQHKLTLVSPSAADYDLTVYKGGCPGAGSAVSVTHTGVGGTETAVVSQTDTKATCNTPCGAVKLCANPPGKSCSSSSNCSCIAGVCSPCVDVCTTNPTYDCGPAPSSVDYYVEVKLVSGNSCAPWTLTLTGLDSSSCN